MLMRCGAYTTALAACAPLFAAAIAQSPPDRMPVQDPKAVMLAALEAPDGRADGVLKGEIADAISRRFASNSPLYIDVTTLARYAQKGCRRLNVRFWQKDVRIDPATPPATQTIDLGLNYCRNGMPPASLRLEGQP